MKKWQKAVHGSLMTVMMANSLPAYAQQAVTIPSGNDVTEGVVGSAAGCSPNSTSTLIQCFYQFHTDVTSPIPAGTALIGSVQGYIAGGLLSATNGWYTNLLQGNAVLSSTNALPVFPGTSASWGIGPTGSAVPANSPSIGLDAQSAEPTKATTGNLTPAFGDLTGKTVTSPYAPRELYVRGTASTAGTAFVTIIGAGGGSLKTYITDIQCGRTDAGTAAITVTFNDSVNTLLVLPNNGGGGGNTVSFNAPLVTAANTTFQYEASAATATTFCSAQGYSGY